ncbi:MAG: M14 family zinc carboxypeptidase [Armatimonadota bacterium]
MMRRLAMAALIGIAVISSSYAATSHARMLRMLAEMDTVKLFSGRGFISTVSIGRSSLGQHIPLVIIRDPVVPVESTARMFVICRQHGNEPASTEAMLGIIRSYFSQSKDCDTDLLKKVTILIVPMMNPDGSLRNKRRNANGADLNRDWLSQSQPETRAVAGAIRKWQPDLIIDAHELDDNDYQRDFIECIGTRSGANPALISKSVEIQNLIRAKLRTHGIKAAAKSASYRSSPRLAHRYYSLRRGIIALLVETRQSGSRAYNCKERARIHMITAMTAARYLAGNKDEIKQEIAQWWNGRSKPGFAYRGEYNRAKENR